LTIQEYITSGILETYALGEGTPVEREAVEKLLAEYSEVRAELLRIEETLEAFALKASVAPRAELKAKVMAGIDAKREARVVSMPSVNSWKYAAAASVAIALLTSYLAYDYRSKWIEQQVAFNELAARNQQVAEDYNVVNQKLNKIQEDLSVIENADFKKVLMKGTPENLQALASVYWNESSKEVYLSIQNLRDISKENQFQLWAIVDGKPVDVGVFDGGFAGLLKMKNVSGAAAFAVTIEPRGGKVSPTLSTMQVVGAISKEKG
jgi:anti-sigma-K factor RskA